MKNKIKYSFLIISIFIFINLGQGCQKNPATGDSEFNLLSESEEDAIGRSEHQKIIKQFGGEYKNPKLKNYVESIGNFLVSTSELSNKEFTFTILNTPIINAFALPGGFVYLTRGLIYLCQNEAQLAGVIAHEIGHITARHSARRYTKSVGTGVLLQILNVFSQNNFVNNLLGQSAQLYLLSYSRSQEYQADQLAVRYMIRAGFDAKEMANFLRIMEEYAQVQREILKIKNKVSELLKTHPNSSKRVQEVIENYKGQTQLNPIVGEEIFLKKIDGIIYGDRPEQGFFYRDSFVHKPLGFRFSFDKDFYFINNPKSLIGITNKKTKIIFDLHNDSGKNNIDYVSKWLKIDKKQILDFESKSHNNFYINIGRFEKNKKTFVFATLQESQELIYRFLLISTKEELTNYNEKFKKMVFSFSKLSEMQIKSLKPPTIKVITAPSNPELLGNVINKMNLQSMHSQKIFSNLNDFKSGKFKPNQKIKTIY